MSSENEPAKVLLPYLQRADELQKHQPLIAYYCRLYAMERGVKIPAKERTKTTNSILISIMNQLEKDKKSLNLGADDKLHVEGFALNVFSKADKQDRGGRADLVTAKTFYAASLFFDILTQFGEVHPDVEQKHKYAAWKAADIRKALKEGRKPLPGPPAAGDDKDPSLPSTSEDDLEPNSSDDQANLRPTRSFSLNTTQYDPTHEYHAIHPQPFHHPSHHQTSHDSHPSVRQETSSSSNEFDSIVRNASVSQLSSTTAPENEYCRDYQPTPDQIAEAQKAARFAASALAFDDIFVAVDYINKSLELLTKPSAGH